MRVIVGIDQETYPPALDLLVALRFAAAELQLVHVIESPLQDLPKVPLDPVRDWLDNLQEQARRELEAARRRLEGSSYQIETTILHGDTPKALIERGREWGADLVAIGSSKKGHWGALFYGSVTKAIAAGAEQSVLVAKQPPRREEGLHVVVATDHSDYFSRCFERFLGWEVGGIRSATVLTSLSREGVPKGALSDKTFDALQEEVREQNEKLCARLREKGVEASSLLSSSPPQDAIATTMKETNADLLILGAQGHGFWDRVRLGSVSYYEVIATDHNVLVLRV